MYFGGVDASEVDRECRLGVRGYNRCTSMRERAQVGLDRGQSSPRSDSPKSLVSDGEAQGASTFACQSVFRREPVPDLIRAPARRRKRVKRTWQRGYRQLE
jgi:hypothetical protein